MKLKTAAAYVIGGLLFTGCPDEQVPPAADSGVIDVRDAALPDATEVVDAGLPPPEVCPRGSGEPVLGDINGDGVLDLADAIALENNLFRGAIAPVCRAAADWNNDGRVEADDSARITTYLVTGAQSARTLPDRQCESANFWPEGQCAPLALDIHAPSRVTSEEFVAAFSIRSPVLVVQGWSMSVRAAGCTISQMSSKHTDAAEVWDDPPGLRHLGYDASKVLEGQENAIAVLSLSRTEDITLPVRAEGSSILRLDMRATLPATGCYDCQISAGDGLRWLGQPIDAVIVAAGYAYRPEVPSAVVQVCAP